MEFQRYTAPDAAALEADIAACRARLAGASEALDLVDCTSDLAALLTTARREGEALDLLQGRLDQAEQFPASEASGWFWNSYATALQYNGRRDAAEPVFAKALELARRGGWRRLQSFVLQHWGRSLVEQGELERARQKFEEALDIRRALDDPRTASTENALAGLARLREAQP